MKVGLLGGARPAGPAPPASSGRNQFLHHWFGGSMVIGLPLSPGAGRNPVASPVGWMRVGFVSLMDGVADRCPYGIGLS